MFGMSVAGGEQGVIGRDITAVPTFAAEVEGERSSDEYSDDTKQMRRLDKIYLLVGLVFFESYCESYFGELLRVTLRVVNCCEN